MTAGADLPLVRLGLWAPCAVVIALALLVPGVARAHALHAEARVEAGEVVLELFFGDGSPARQAEVIVRRLAASGAEVAPPGGEVVGGEVARGLTDDEGVFRFRPAQAGRYRLEGREVGLHQAQVEVHVAPDEVGAPGQTPPTSPPVSGAVSGSVAPIPTNGETPAAEPVQRSKASAARERVVRERWVRVLTGLVLIAGLAGALALWQRREGSR